ncbi:U exon [simian adenovirus 55]|uniref:U exon n=1 Tax=simian adenovirus 55 TaxID=2848082 RepID=A0A1L3INY4_9ADEN|nr:U exon [Simian mastadenovirus WIV19]APG53816.1 U exon [Simian mastadenovirus WIV19]
MRVVGSLSEEWVNVPFRVWRKYAAKHNIGYESWEEGRLVVLDKDTEALWSDLR